MARKDISDWMVCMAYNIYAKRVNEGYLLFVTDVLMSGTGQPEKVCLRAMERAQDRGLVECGVSLRTGRLTEKGKDILTNTGKTK